MATVLVVDDEPDLLLLARCQLERAGHGVTTATDGSSALAALGTSLPDLIVLDVMMPDVDGWTVLGRVKASTDQRVREIPIVMLTGVCEPEAKARAGIEGAVRWVRKPFAVEDLLAAVDAALAEPEPIQRRRAQHRALESLARLESGCTDGLDADSPATTASRPRLSGLERPNMAIARAPVGRTGAVEVRVDRLTDTQRAVLEAVKRAPTIQAAAATLGVSRSSLYATLRRAARRLGVRSVPELLTVVRTSDQPLPR